MEVGKGRDSGIGTWRTGPLWPKLLGTDIPATRLVRWAVSQLNYKLHLLISAE